MSDYGSLADFAAGFESEVGAMLAAVGQSAVEALAGAADPALRAATPVGSADDPHAGRMQEAWEMVPGASASGAASIEINNMAAVPGSGGGDVPGLEAVINDAGRRVAKSGRGAGSRLIGSTDAPEGVTWPALKSVFSEGDSLVQEACDAQGGSV